MRPGVILVLLSLLGSGSALAGQPFPLVLDGELVGGAVESGLVLLEDGEALWTCEETLPGEPAFWRVEGDGILVGTDAGVLRSVDGGCSWQPAWGPLASLGATDLASLDAVLLVTADGLWRSADDGDSWQEVPMQPAGLVPTSAVADGPGDTLRLVGVDAEGLPHLVASDDGGQGWLAPLPLEGWIDAELLLLRPDGEALYLAATSGIGDPFLLALDADLTSSTQVLDLPAAPVVGAVMQGDDLLYVVRGEGLFRRAQGGAPTAVAGGPTGCIERLDGLLWGCGQGESLFQVSEQGELWSAALDWQDVAPRDCPDGTPGRELCPAAWEALQGDDDDSAGPVGDDDDSGGVGEPAPDCGCSSAGGGGPELVLVLFVAAALSRGSRPRRRCG